MTLKDAWEPCLKTHRNQYTFTSEINC